jgi:hypothetical protein
VTEPETTVAGVERELGQAVRVLAHIPHPHLGRRAAAGPVKAAEQMPAAGRVARFNRRLGVLVTNAVGTMWCAYLFAGLALTSLPDAIRGGRATIVSWVAQTLLQLVLLSVIMVGQRVDSAAGDARAKAAYDDGAAVLHYVDQLTRSLTHLHAKVDQLTPQPAPPAAPVMAAPPPPPPAAGPEPGAPATA